MRRQARRAPGPASAGAGGCHAPAFLGAAPTRVGTQATVLHLAVLRAFLGAGIADLGAGFADSARTFAGARQVSGSQAADLGAVDVERNAARHRLHVFFSQARSGAVVAGLRTGVAGGDAGLELVMGHGVSLQWTAATGMQVPLPAEPRWPCAV